jgi:hypothetical protein
MNSIENASVGWAPVPTRMRAYRVGTGAHPTRRALALLLFVAAAQACAQSQPAPPPQALQQDLYQDALQSIAEGRRNDASRELMRLIEKEPLHAGAWLDLAMTQCALGHADEAERLFATIETRFNPSREMLELIAHTREEGCNDWQPVSSWSISTSRGIDQNVNQGAMTSTYRIDAPQGPVEHELSDDFKPKHDQYTMVSGEYSREVSPNGSIGFAQFVTRRNDYLRQYDSASLFAGLESPWRVGHWSLRASGTAGLVMLGGKLYQRQFQLQGRVTPPLPLPNRMQLSVLASASYNDFLTLTNFNSNTFELRSQLTYRKPDLYASTSLGYLDDHALAQRPGGDRHGWFGNLMVRRRLVDNLSGELGYTHQTWDSRLPYSPGLIEQVRAQVTGVVRASLTYAISKNQSLQLEARVVHNRENISIFQYNNRQLQLTWQMQGP